MIESISLRGIPCFGADPEPMEEISEINFIYGPNGSGKSSTSKRIYEMVGQNKECLLFNKNFTDRLLLSEDGIPGVFVIRDADPEIQKRIIELEGNPEDAHTPGEIQAKRKNRDGKLKSIEEKNNIVASAKTELKEVAWKKRKPLVELMRHAFEGTHQSKQKNVEKVLSFHELPTPEDLPDLSQIEQRYRNIQNSPSETINRIQSFPAEITENLSDADKNLISEPIQSSTTTAVANFIDRIGNIDWVRKGFEYQEKSESKCPYCQQEISETIKRELLNLFDDSYEKKLAEVRKLSRKIKQQIEIITKYKEAVRSSKWKDLNNLSRLLDRAHESLLSQERMLERKLEHPAQDVLAGNYYLDISKIQEEVELINSEIDKENSDRTNRDAVRKTLEEQLWFHYVKVVLASDIGKYEGTVDGPLKAISNMSPNLQRDQTDLENLLEELKELKQQVTSSRPTVEAINTTLKNLGFLSFKVQIEEGQDRYSLVRTDNTPVSDTLSEGEKTFISFLYYYHQIKAKNKDQREGTRITAVIDDPVSSLDGETLFVINLLLRDILDICVNNHDFAYPNGNLEQLFLFSHNAYFFKEATFTPRGQKSGKRAYYIFTKGVNSITTHRRYEKAPIKSNYEQLWSQVRQAGPDGNLEVSASIGNAMRRIIENYFSISGGIDTEQIISKIPEDERWASKSLLSWYNDSSHTAPWDVDYTSLATDTSVYLQAFRAIFEVSGHIAHYEMMMHEPQ